MEAVLTRVAAFVLIIALGYGLKRAGFFKASDFGLIASVVLKITIPCAVVSYFSKITPDFTLFWLVVLGVVCNLIPISLGWLVGLTGGRRDQAFNMINFSGYNIGCFALPFIQTFLGPVGVVATCLFDAGNSVMCTGATYSMAAAVAGGGEGTTVRLFFKRMFSSVPMDTYIAMVVLAAFDWKLPAVAVSFADMVGAANPFLAMLMLGIGFELQLKKDDALRILKTLFIRYAMAGSLAYVFWHWAPFTEEIRRVLAILALAPVSAICTIFTSLCLKDARETALSCTVNSLSIVISIVLMTTLLLVTP